MYEKIHGKVRLSKAKSRLGAFWEAVWKRSGSSLCPDTVSCGAGLAGTASWALHGEQLVGAFPPSSPTRVLRCTGLCKK